MAEESSSNIYFPILVSIFFDVVAELLRYIKTSRCRVVIEQNNDDHQLDNMIDNTGIAGEEQSINRA